MDKDLKEAINDFHKLMNRDFIIEFIKIIRESFVGAETVYTKGSCYQFYRILKQVFPQAVAYYDVSHVITDIDGRFYDITGEVEKINHLEMEEHFPDAKAKSNKYDITNDRISG